MTAITDVELDIYANLDVTSCSIPDEITIKRLAIELKRSRAARFSEEGRNMLLNIRSLLKRDNADCLWNDEIAFVSRLLGER